MKVKVETYKLSVTAVVRPLRMTTALLAIQMTLMVL